MGANELDPLANGSNPISRFAGGLIDILDRVEYSRVRMDVVDNPVYRLRYEAYRREEFVPFNDAGIVTDDLDGTPNAFCYGIHVDGELVSSIRIHHVTSEHRKGPSIKSCRDVLDPLLDKGQSFIDPSRFTADYEASLAYPALPFLTLRIAVMATDYFSTTACLALVRREHSAFYRRVFGAIEMSDVREYPGLTFPVVLFGSNAAINLQQIYRRYPFFRSTFEEQQALFSQTDLRGFQYPIPTAAREAVEQALVDHARTVAAE
ncbi:MAG: acetyltransferase [Devosia sp.]